MRTIPSLHRQDNKIDIRHQLVAELARQFADRFAVAHGEGMQPDERKMVRSLG